MAESTPATQPMLAHMVYFTLHESSEATRAELVASCHRYLKDHPGIVYFSVGTRVEDLAREVNDREFDVSLNVVFANREAHDQYQTAPTHLQFISENRAKWKQVRVYDSYLT